MKGKIVAWIVNPRRKSFLICFCGKGFESENMLWILEKILGSPALSQRKKTS